MARILSPRSTENLFLALYAATIAYFIVQALR